MKSLISPKIKIGKSKSGKGLFCVKKISNNELVIDYTSGRGEFLSAKEADAFYGKGNDYILQIGNDLFFATTKEEDIDDSDFLNHSCSPNCGIKGKFKIVAMRDIFPGEEITFDYAMSESSDYKMKCLCGSSNCRKLITGDDWKIKKLQERYNGFFSEYLQKKIDNGI